VPAQVQGDDTFARELSAVEPIGPLSQRKRQSLRIEGLEFHTVGHPRVSDTLNECAIRSDVREYENFAVRILDADGINDVAFQFLVWLRCAGWEHFFVGG